jgi:nucleotide-binding universal stress UspA family protein
MDVLVPVDGSKCSERALEYAAEFVTLHEGSIHVVHFTDVRGDDTAALLEKVEDKLSAAGLDDDPEVVVDIRLSNLRSSGRVGRDVLDYLDNHEFDHVVMGHHGQGRVERLILGSATEKVVRGTEVPVTVVP